MQLSTPIEPAWKTYLKSAIFLAPAFAFSAIAAVFVLPKLKTVWRDAGIDDTPEIWMLHTTDAILGNGMLTFWIILGAIVLLELALKKIWPRFRRATLGTIVFLLNGLALYTITLMCIASMLAVPALTKAQIKPNAITDPSISTLHVSR